MQKLFDEILEIIFSYLDIDSLKNAVEVSEKWSAIIKSSRKVGRNHSIEIQKNSSGALLLKIPIDGLKYGCVEILFADYGMHLTEILKCLEKYQSSIFKAKFREFILNEEVVDVLCNVTQISCIHLMSIYRFYSNFKDNSLIHLKYVSSGPEKLFDDLLPRQTKSLQHLKIRCIELNPKAMQDFIENCKSLRTLELELKNIDGSWDLLKSIKDHKSEQQHRKKWNELIFTDVRKEDQELVSLILANHQEISTLTFQYLYGNAQANGILSILRLAQVTFNFTGNDHRTYEDFKKVYSLTYDWFNGNDMQLFIDLLNRCPNLKVLKLVLYTKLTQEIIQRILNAVQDLEELHISENPGSRSNDTDNMVANLQAIKTHGNDLKRLFLVLNDYSKDEKDKIVKMREQVKIFKSSSVQVFVMGFRSDTTDCYYTSYCTWKK